MRNLRVYPKRMLANLNLTHGLIHSQQVLLLLTDKGSAGKAPTASSSATPWSPGRTAGTCAP